MSALPATLLAFAVWAALPASSPAQITTSISSGIAAPGGSVTLAISAALAGTQAAALQWTLNYPSTDIAGVSISLGPGAKSADKTVTCNVAGETTTCVLCGLNETAINGGTVATATFQISSNPADSTVPIQISKNLASSQDGTAISAVGTGGSIEISFARKAEVVSLSCSSAVLITPDSVPCSVTLSVPAPEAGFTVQLASNNSAMNLPASITVPAGRSTASFTATAGKADLGTPSGGIATVETAALTASARPSSSTFVVTLLPSLNGSVQLVSENSGLCLDVRNMSTAEGATVQQWDCGRGANQQWLFAPTGDGSYAVISVNSNLSLEVLLQSTENGAPVVQQSYSGEASEKWRLQPVGANYYNLIVEHSGKCLDVTGARGATPDGVPAQQWYCWGGATQAWQLLTHNQ